MKISKARSASFAPVVSPTIRVLILGSLPGQASLAAQAYYAHPRNQFWRILGDLLHPAAPESLPTLPYSARLAFLREHGIGLWDVVHSAQRQGSLDADIREPRFNDLAALCATLPRLRGVVFNGQTAARAAGRLPPGLRWHVAPSTSPAHTLPYAEKCTRWAAVLGDYLMPLPVQFHGTGGTMPSGCSDTSGCLVGESHTVQVT